jgi:hypothetical protein
MRILCRCGAPFKRSGLRNHQQMSNDPLCCLVSEANSSNNTSEPAAPPSLEPITSVDYDMEADPAGDYFGNYLEYSLAELGLDDDEGFLNDLVEKDFEDEEEAFEEVEAEQGQLEAERHNKGHLEGHGNHDPVNSGLEAETRVTMRLRGGAEGDLGKEPHVVKFTKGNAGAVYTRNGVNVNTEYTNNIGMSENAYKPFSSKVEWEIARWAKTRGPSSTAFTELMNIDGVCLISHIITTTILLMKNLTFRYPRALVCHLRTQGS